MSRRLLMASGGSGSFTPPAEPPPSGPLAFWTNAVANRITTPVKYTLIGTSITAGVGASTPSLSWAGRLQAELVANFGAYFTQRNEGVSGANVVDFLGSAAVTGIPSDTSLVVIEIGVNDAFDGISAATFQGSLEDLIDEVRVVVPDASILLIGSYRLDNTSAALWNPYLAIFPTIATDKNCAYLSIPDETAATLVGPIAFAAPGTSEVLAGFTVNAYNTLFNLPAGGLLTKTITTVFSAAAVGLIADVGGTNQTLSSAVGTETFTRVESAQTDVALYSWPYSAGYTGSGTYTYVIDIARGDGVHPNDAGHLTYFQRVYATLI